MRKNVMKKWVVIGLSCVLVVTLSGCGAKTEATNQAPESSNVVVGDEKENVEEDASASVGAENENIVLYAEIAEYGEYGVDAFNYVEQPGIVNAKEDILIYNDKGIEVGYIKAGSSVSVTEGAEMGGWARFKNPIEGTDYDYLYVLKKFVTDPDALIFDAESMKQGIIDYINTYWLADIDYNFVDEKISDMEMIEFNMECEYDDNIEFWYWLAEGFREATSISSYETLYVECEDDVEGWITCRIYYKDYVEVNQY